MTALEKFEEYGKYLEDKGWKVAFNVQSNEGFTIHIWNEDIHFVSPIYPSVETDGLYIFTEDAGNAFVEQKDFNRIVSILSNSDAIIKEFMETLPKEEK